jgi:hypothetical protein
MKIILCVLALIGCCYGFSQAVIFDTKQTGSIGVRTGDYCGFEDLKVWPGEQQNTVFEGNLQPLLHAMSI